MKRLKRRHLFGGKLYPLYVALTVFFIVLFAGIAAVHIMMLAVPAAIVSLIVCAVIEQHLEPAERDQIAETEMPLWEPVTPEIRQLVCDQHQGTQLSIGHILGICGIGAGFTFLAAAMPSRRGRVMASPATAFGIALIVGVIVFLWLMISKGIGANWLEIDETAVYTKIPIDHMYDVTHHGKRGRTWTTSYIVFYQPDGRYVLRAPDGSGDCNTVTIVKFRKSITWLVTSELRPEDYL